MLEIGPSGTWKR